MNFVQSTAYALVAWLKTVQPFNGTRADIAAALGVPIIYVDLALAWLRHPDQVAAHGYTIPKQSRGNAYNKAWEVVDVADGPILIPEKATNGASLERVSEETVAVLGKLIAHLDVLYGKCDHRSAYGKKVAAMTGILTGVSLSIETLVIPV